ncbi:Protein of unknown function DUF1592 [Chthoniobacter flavus Ellin428]|uniref:Cytochrome c domain-containing protein n=1 Tax=Chthoniobacter flavus Ellin428 TaxID=497964 RepID=B4D7Q6_9BACT|nr:DUF1592 domain-containing protein [Chthoniobacter flavus]EDY17546.1 Protein of unknown function DUF1592 [Chthoniobacter flavus Ellin428]TCO92421.1 cytochrome c [Chthoniobacter flavus]
MASQRSSSSLPLWLASAVTLVAFPWWSAAGEPDFAQAQAVMKEHCYKCHGAEKQKGDVNLEEFKDASAIAKEPEIWAKVVDVLRGGDMPPSKEPKMADNSRDLLAGWVEQTLDAAIIAKGPDPGPPMIRRLTHAEYRRAVRDLFGIDFDSAGAVGMPEDPVGRGYDNLAVALKIPPALTEKYVSAADETLARLFDPKAQGNNLAGAINAQLRARGASPAQMRETARALMSRLLPRAYRRPVGADETARYVALFDAAIAQRKAPAEAFRFMFKAVLLSPNFLFRVEPDRAGATQPYHVNDLDLASRLSFFLWSSIPDDELLALASQGKLSDPATLRAQVTRMLASPKAKALAEDFAAQWLQLKKLAEARPTIEFFPTFTEELKESMRQEPILFFDALRTSNLPVTDLIDSDFTFLNGALAEHYGISGIKGTAFQRVALQPEEHRGGVLGMGAVLSMTSHTFRTSPTQRGKYVLEVLLGTPPPPPPNNVAQIEDAAAHGEAKSFRELLAQHATDASCAGCHKRIDPLGFGLDHYDAIGRWRESTKDQPLDTAGVLPTGEKFDGPMELKQVLKAKQQRFIENLSEQMLIYALGRELRPADKLAVKKIAADLTQDGFHFSSLISGVVNSYPFQNRRNFAPASSTKTAAR